MESYQEEINKLKTEIKYLKSRQALVNKFGPEYDKYYEMPLDELLIEVDKINRLEWVVRHIKADRLREDRRSKGINCKCTATSICSECDPGD